MHYTLIKMKNDLYTSRKATYMNTDSTTTHIFTRQPLTSGGSVEIGPFTTAGTYHIYCTVHQGMNLEIIVQ
jgi:plastocyanin